MKKAKRFNVGGPMATAPNGPVSLVKNGLGGLPSSSLPPPSKNIQQGDAFPQGSGPRPTGPALGGVGPRPTGPESPTDMTKINALKAQLNGQNSSDTGSMSPRRVAAKLLSGTRGMGTPGIRGATKQPPMDPSMMKKGGAVKASKRGDGIAQRGKTKGRMV